MPDAGPTLPHGSLADPLPANWSTPGAANNGSFAYLAGTIDFDARTVTTEAPRLGQAAGDTYDLDATDFFTQHPCTDCVEVTGFTFDANDDLAVDVRLRHPFSAASARWDLNVFDVRGILILPGNTSFAGTHADLDGDGAIGSDESLQGNFTTVRNADGYTTRFDARAEDPLIWGAPKHIAGNVNPFRRYFVNTGNGAFDAHAPAGHNVLGLGMAETQSWVIDRPPNGGGSIPFVFVVDAAFGSAGPAAAPIYRLPEFN
ncbi:MAG: hypothetical protein ABI743_05445, partial [bacterium]